MNKTTKDLRKKRWASEPETVYLKQYLRLESWGAHGYTIDKICFLPQPWAKTTPRPYLEQGGEHRLTLVETRGGECYRSPMEAWLTMQDQDRYQLLPKSVR